jgi:transcriptional regulator with XRE-family HTH domain
MPRHQTAHTDQIDRHVARRLRERRLMLGLTLGELGEILGISYQQLHKDERAINRLSAGRLYEMAQALNVPITYFYTGIDEDPVSDRPGTRRERLLLETLHSVGAINDPQLQEAVSQVVRSLAAV